MKPRWDGPRLFVQSGSRHIFRPDHQTAGGHDVQELWRWWCMDCTKAQGRFVGDNSDDLDDGLTWFVAHLAEFHVESDDEGGPDA